ncbi:MAG: diguanylate cyclase [Oscillospiraceae bacterium]|jgi:diguanylate cyclase (GGDEF)-like protein|nr:diguanylate cyclase [Oscillospiraceae bacterium]
MSNTVEFQDENEKHKILICDDSRQNLVELNKILSADYSLYMANTGKDALRIAAESEPDLILLDIMMSDMNGFEVIAELKASEDTKEIPVIFITGLDGEAEEEKGLGLGAVDYITKPFSGAIIKARVKTQIKLIDQIRRISYMSLYDELTGLPNRRYFNAKLELEWGTAMRDNIPLSFLMLDLDKFKVYNDTYGHNQGDILLAAVGKILDKYARRATDMSARWGGEEFAVILQNTSVEPAAEIAERIRAAIENLDVPLYERPEVITKVTVSIGVSSINPASDKEKMNELMTRADDCLYEAKAAGRNRVVVEPQE